MFAKTQPSFLIVYNINVEKKALDLYVQVQDLSKFD